jgi:hypothetical protein
MYWLTAYDGEAIDTGLVRLACALAVYGFGAYCWDPPPIGDIESSVVPVVVMLEDVARFPA